MKRLIKYLFLFFFTATICFSLGYFAWKLNHRYEAGKSELVITGKVEIFESYDPYEKENLIIAIVNKGDKVKILDFYSEHDFGGIEVELLDGRRGYIHYFRAEKNYEIIRKED